MVDFTQLIQNQFDKMCKTGKLFRSAVTGDMIWDLYISKFENEHNPVFRDPESSTHNCNYCRNFLRRYGNVVAVDDNNEIVTMFDVDAPLEYINSAKAISKALKSAPIANVFFETYDNLRALGYDKKIDKNDVKFKLGVDKNTHRYTKEEAEKFGVVKANELVTFRHLNISVPKQFVSVHSKLSVESIMGNYRDSKNVFARCMQEIPLDVLKLVKDLINEGSLLDGTTHLYKVEQIIPLKEKYDSLNASERDNWCWVNSYNFALSKFKNELIGVLCTDLAEGKDLNESCKLWNKRVDPANYMKAKAPITKKQIEEAERFVVENGYVESFNRRFATIDDIKASEILHINTGNGNIKSLSIFDNVKPTASKTSSNGFDGIEEVSIDKFMTSILPECTSVEAYFSGKHEGNLVSLTTANAKESKPIFKWDNNYSWTFKGDLAGKSMIKEAVKSAGGKVDGVLRFSIIWNEDGRSIVDFDAHCKTPTTEIDFGRKQDHHTGGWLDVDMIRPQNLGVENITWQDKSKMRDGNYHFFNRNYDRRPNNGFKAEIEVEGAIYSYEFSGNIQEDTPVATVSLKNGVFTINHHSKQTTSSKELYGLQTEQFHKVNLLCLSPNHWGDNNVGNKYYLFMLDGCKCPNSIRSFHSENLIPELAGHRKVLEVLGNTTRIEPSSEQLTGIGFNATVSDELIVKLQGYSKKMVKIKF